MKSKEEIKAQQKKWRKDNPENLKAIKKKYYQKYKVKISAQSKKDRQDNPEKFKISKSKYYQKYKVKISAQSKKDRQDNPMKYKVRDKKPRLDNPMKYRIRRNIYYQNNKARYKKYFKKRLENPEIKAFYTVINRHRKVLWQQSYGENKTEKIVKNLGCDGLTLVNHLQRKFRDGMNWENYGKVWHIDHILPLAQMRDTEEETLNIFFNYKNLQPLLIPENLSKGSKLKGDIPLNVISKLKMFNSKGEAKEINNF